MVWGLANDGDRRHSLERDIEIRIVRSTITPTRATGRIGYRSPLASAQRICGAGERKQGGGVKLLWSSTTAEPGLGLLGRAAAFRAPCCLYALSTPLFLSKTKMVLHLQKKTC